MSNEQEDGLQPAALVVSDDTSRHFDLRVTLLDNRPPETEPKDELVRRKDVARLIQDKIDDLQELEEKITNGVERQGFRQARREVEELLDEVENQQ